MGIEQRRFPRYAVHLAVTYSNAAQFVADYIENLSAGGLFIAGAHQLTLEQVVNVTIALPGRGEWQIVAKAVFILDPQLAKQTGRKAGAGMEIVGKPPGFDDALLGYLVRLGRRREHAVIAAEIPGASAIADAGYQLLPLGAPADVARALASASSNVVAVIVPPSFVTTYRQAAGERLFAATTPDEIADALARIDSLL